MPNQNEIALLVGGPRAGTEIRVGGQLLPRIQLYTFDTTINLSVEPTPTATPTATDTYEMVVYRLTRFTTPVMGGLEHAYVYFYVPNDIPHHEEGQYVMEELWRSYVKLAAIKEEYPGLVESVEG